jgi:hypothetical protein
MYLQLIRIICNIIVFIFIMPICANFMLIFYANFFQPICKYLYYIAKSISIFKLDLRLLYHIKSMKYILDPQFLDIEYRRTHNR